MPLIDERLLAPNGKPEISENFNRVLNLLDNLDGSTSAQGTPGVGIQSITGTIDGSNKLTLTFTLTDESTQTVEAQISPPASG